MIVLLIKVVIEEYINHIAPYSFNFVESRPFKNERWYRANWMAIEFNLLYRWHGLIPDPAGTSGSADEPIWRTVFNPALVVGHGIGAAVRGRLAPAGGARRAAQHRAGVARERTGEHPQGARGATRAV